MSLKRIKDEKNAGFSFFRNPLLPQISTFSFGQKGRALLNTIRRSGQSVTASNTLCIFFLISPEYYGLLFLALRYIYLYPKWG